MQDQPRRLRKRTLTPLAEWEQKSALKYDQTYMVVGRY